MNQGVHIDVVSVVDDDLLTAMQRLVSQLSPSAPVLTRETLQQVVDSASTTLIVARDEAHAGRIIGSLTLAVFRIPTGVRAWIEDVVVDTDQRGRGAGEALSREAIRIAHMRGARTIELTSRPTRVAANRLYVRLGFRLRETNVYRYSTADATPDGGAES